MNISTDNLRDILSYLDLKDQYNFMQASKECFNMVKLSGPKDHILKRIVPYGISRNAWQMDKLPGTYYMYVHKDAILIENVGAELKCIIQTDKIFFVTRYEIFSKAVELFNHYDHTMYVLDSCYMTGNHGSYGHQMTPKDSGIADPVIVYMNIMKFSTVHSFSPGYLNPYHIKITRRPMFT